ncbi:hypothetical protein CLOM_g10570 [Closterium sp. NIES-68]|nr:hypothetical protein CLOM_g10570 [Closterium sp. NIES-68]
MGKDMPRQLVLFLGVIRDGSIVVSYSSHKEWDEVVRSSSQEIPPYLSRYSAGHGGVMALFSTFPSAPAQPKSPRSPSCAFSPSRTTSASTLTYALIAYESPSLPRAKAYALLARVHEGYVSHAVAATAVTSPRSAQRRSSSSSRPATSAAAAVPRMDSATVSRLESFLKSLAQSTRGSRSSQELPIYPLAPQAFLVKQPGEEADAQRASSEYAKAEAARMDEIKQLLEQELEMVNCLVKEQEAQEEARLKGEQGGSVEGVQSGAAGCSPLGVSPVPGQSPSRSPQAFFTPVGDVSPAGGVSPVGGVSPPPGRTSPMVQRWLVQEQKAAAAGKAPAHRQSSPLLDCRLSSPPAHAAHGAAAAYRQDRSPAEEAYGDTQSWEGRPRVVPRSLTDPPCTLGRVDAPTEGMFRWHTPPQDSQHPAVRAPAAATVPPAAAAAAAAAAAQTGAGTGGEVAGSAHGKSSSNNSNTNSSSRSSGESLEPGLGPLHLNVSSTLGHLMAATRPLLPSPDGARVSPEGTHEVPGGEKGWGVVVGAGREKDGRGSGEAVSPACGAGHRRSEGGRMHTHARTPGSAVGVQGMHAVSAVPGAAAGTPFLALTPTSAPPATTFSSTSEAAAAAVAAAAAAAATAPRAVRSASPQGTRYGGGVGAHGARHQSPSALHTHRSHSPTSYSPPAHSPTKGSAAPHMAPARPRSASPYGRIADTGDFAPSGAFAAVAAAAASGGGGTAAAPASAVANMGGGGGGRYKTPSAPDLLAADLKVAQHLAGELDAWQRYSPKEGDMPYSMQPQQQQQIQQAVSEQPRGPLRTQPRIPNLSVHASPPSSSSSASTSSRGHSDVASGPRSSQHKSSAPGQRARPRSSYFPSEASKGTRAATEMLEQWEGRKRSDLAVGGTAGWGGRGGEEGRAGGSRPEEGRLLHGLGQKIAALFRHERKMEMPKSASTAAAAAPAAAAQAVAPAAAAAAAAAAREEEAAQAAAVALAGVRRMAGGLKKLDDKIRDGRVLGKEG